MFFKLYVLVVDFTSDLYIMQNVYLKLKNMNFDNQEIKKQIEELKQIINDEYEVNIVNIKAKERNGSKQENIDNIVKEYEKILEKINKNNEG